jgi:1,4-dihydroxy-6-naphthoate synthase
MTLMDQPVSARASHYSALKTLRVAYTNDSDDAFNFYAWEHGHVELEGFTPRFERSHIIHLNRAALAGVHDVTNISSATYPALAEQYFVLAVGTSIGRGYGPVMVSKNYSRLDELRGKRVAVGGFTTTGAALAEMYCPGIVVEEFPYDQIADAILAGRFDAGVMIHEELLFYPNKGLRRVADLGATWCEQTGLPLTVGLNVVHRRHGRDTAVEIVRTCRDSLRWAQQHPDEAIPFANQFGRGCARDFVKMFSNSDTLCMPEDARRGMRAFFDRLAETGLARKINQIEVIDA